MPEQSDLPPSARLGHGSAASVLAAVVLVVAAAVGGWLVGRANAPTDHEAIVAKRAAQMDADRTSFAVAIVPARARGRLIGRKQGQLAGAREGRAAGTRKGRAVALARARREARRRAAAEARARTQAAAPCPAGQQLLNQMGVRYCGRPGPARPQDCPAGWEPVGVTGACAPREDSTVVERCSFSPQLPECRE